MKRVQIVVAVVVVAVAEQLAAEQSAAVALSLAADPLVAGPPVAVALSADGAGGIARAVAWWTEYVVSVDPLELLAVWATAVAEAAVDVAVGAAGQAAADAAVEEVEGAAVEVAASAVVAPVA